MINFKNFLSLNESFNNDNSKVWIIGIPSGEALQVDRDTLDYLFKEKLIYYTTQYVSIGFHAFKDTDVEKIKTHVNKEEDQSNVNRDVSIYDNNFDKVVVNTILSMIEDYPYEVDFYVQGDHIGIDFEDLYIEVMLDDGTKSSKYTLIKRHKGKVIDKYNIAADTGLINRIYHEIVS